MNATEKEHKDDDDDDEEELENRMFSFFSLCPVFRIHDLPKPNKQASASAQSTNKNPDSESNPSNKPSIIEIINETEKNSARLQASPMVPSGVVETSKAIMDVGHGHPGIAEPLTWQQLESEMAVDQSLRDSSTSTSKDGISTWILLSGSEKQKPSSTPAPTTVAGHVDKIQVKDLPQSISSDRHNYRFEPINQDKLTKPLKNRPDKKPKTTTVAPPTSSVSPILLASDFIAANKLANRRKHPVAQVKVNKRKATPTTRTTTTTTTSTTTPEPPTTTTASVAVYEPAEIITEKNDIEPNPSVERTEEIEVITVTTTPYPFIVLEPKDADFDLPQDRSPTTKKPKRNNTKTKRKNGQKNKVATAASNAVSKLPANKEKPISTKIYNYLSREVMPTVGVGLMGLVVTAGLASYFFGPLTALRRSYDDALDRQDNVDSIYQVNSEEYATNGAEGGQNEEEIFGKFIAGMPASNVPKYVRYYKPDQQTPYHAYNTQRRVYGQPQAAPKFNGPNPYVRYRTEPNNNVGFQKNAPSPHFNPAQYHPQHVALRNHQPVSPVYDPRYHETHEQKSFANKMDQVLKQTPTYTAAVADQTVQINEKSTNTDILADETQIEAKHAGTVLDDDVGIDDSNKIQRRTNTFVVGSALSDDIRPDETIVSASMTAASADDMIASNGNEPVAAAVTSVTAASHGPRRRRRRSAAIVEEIKPTASEKKSVETPIVTDSSITSTTSTTTTQAPYTGRIYDRNDAKMLEIEFSQLKMRMPAPADIENGADAEKKIHNKIQIEFARIESDFLALKKALNAVQDIAAFQKQLKLRAKNYELSVALRTGIAQTRQRIKLLMELVEHPDDDRIVQKINRRDGNNNPTSEISNGSTTNEPGPIAIDDQENNGFIGFLKLLQLKAQFGLNILKTIKPSFERAFEEVFKRPLKED